MNSRRVLEIGGVIAGVIMIAFGIGALVLSLNARSTVGDELSQEAIVGSPDMNPADIKTAAGEAGLPATIVLPSCDVADKAIENGSDARCFAQYMRIHALESSGGLTYAQMGRFLAASAPTDPKGTSDETAALKDADGKPVSNAARNTWVTETALATALNVSYIGGTNCSLRRHRRDRAFAQWNRIPDSRRCRSRGSASRVAEVGARTERQARNAVVPLIRG